jgi:hypothetical protein
MTPSDSLPPGTGQTSGLDQPNPNAPLTLVDVKNIISQAQKGVADPVTMGMQMFNNLGDNITVSGDTLRQALTESGIAVDGALSGLVAAAQNITKSGSHVTVTNTEETKTQISGTTIRFKPLVAFDVGTAGGFPTVSNIQGAAAHKLFWIEITQIQLQQNQGKRILHVQTSAGARDFPLPSEAA